MKQTSVEWLVEQIRKYGIVSEVCIEQAKQMEKQQLVDFTYLIADDLACGVYTRKHIEDMFDETFKSE